MAATNYVFDFPPPEFIDQLPGETIGEYLTRTEFEAPEDQADDDDQPTDEEVGAVEIEDVEDAEVANSFEGHEGRPGLRGGSLPKGEAKTKAEPELPEPEMPEFEDGDVAYDIQSKRGRVFKNAVGELRFKPDGASWDTTLSKQKDETESEHWARIKADKAVAGEFLDELKVEKFCNGSCPEEFTIAGKRFVCSNLAKDTGADEDRISAGIHQWADSSNDTLYGSLLTQQAATVLGATPSKWQDENFESLDGKRNARIKQGWVLNQDKHISPFEKTTHFAGDNDHDESWKIENTYPGATTPLEAHQKFLSAMYDRTQKHLAKNGIKYVTLYRGATLPDDAVKDAQVGDKVNIISNALESWSSRKYTGFIFSDGAIKGEKTGILLKATVPASSIVSTPATGFGCLNEHEFVVHNAKKFPCVLIYKT